MAITLALNIDSKSNQPTHNTTAVPSHTFVQYSMCERNSRICNMCYCCVVSTAILHKLKCCNISSVKTLVKPLQIIVLAT